MKILSFDNNSWPKIDEEIALCLGYFDGVHIGHKKIVSEAHKLSKKIGVLTFDKSPAEILNKDHELLTDRDEKIRLFTELGVDYYFEVKINEDFLNLSKEEFVNNIINNINPKIVLCGNDYSFGKNKEGNVEYLKSRIETKIVDFETLNNEKISSTKIKQLIHQGNVLNVFKYLGRDYSVSGTVIKGLGNGKKLDFPTANLLFKSNYALPKEGVYYGITKIGKKTYKSIASFGTHPTISELEKPILEIHILNYKKDLYDKELEFTFIRFLRENKKFATESELKSQIENDKKSINTMNVLKLELLLILPILFFVIVFLLIEFFL